MSPGSSRVLSPAVTASSAGLPVDRLDITDNNSKFAMAANSQIAWLASLNPQYESPKGDDKYLRKVSTKPTQFRATSACQTVMPVCPRSCLTSQTSIIGTIGPKTNSVEMITKLTEAGLNIGACSHVGSVDLKFA